MIKVLFFIETLAGGGAEKVLCNLVNRMDRAQFDITVQTVWPCDQKKYLAPWIRYSSLYPSVSPVNRFLYRAEAAAGISYPLRMKGGYDLECAYLECGATKILAGSTNRKAVKLAWVHCDLQVKAADPAAFVKSTQKYYRKFDRVVCVSESVRASFRKLYGRTPESLVVYNTVDDARIRALAKEALPDGPKKRKTTVVCLGRLTKEKNIQRLLTAHRDLLRRGYDHDLWILGEGSERPTLEKFISDNGLCGSAKLLGFRENPYPFLREADLLACSSDYEGFSTFATEGLILGKPIVTTECAGMRELLGDCEYGLITENEDKAFCRGMETMLSNPAIRNSYAQKAEKRGADFSAAKMVSDTEKFFRSLAANNAKL